MRKRAVLYTRISRSTDESVSLDRQARELREVAETEGWDVVRVLSDDGVSGRVEREQADEALNLLAQGDAEVLLVWEMSRWSRMGLTIVAKLVGVLRDRKDALFVAKREGLRSDQPAFGIMAAVIAEVAAMEAEATRDRIRSMRQSVLGATDPADQRWLGGAVPLGYRVIERPGGAGKALVIDDQEAEALREVARRFLAGRTLAELTRYLQDAGVATAQSPLRRARLAGRPTEGLDAGTWRITTVRKLLQSPTLLGRTTQGDRVVTDAQGIPIERWAPVLDAGTWSAMQAKFSTREPYQTRKAASWLSGFLYCGLCGSVLYANARKDRTVGSFRCSNRAIPGQTCPGVSISRRLVEEYMEDWILRGIGDLPEYRTTERVEDAGSAEELASIGLDIADVQSALAEDGADYPALLRKLDGLKARRRSLVDSPGRLVRTVTPTGRLLRDAWEAGGVTERQALIEGMLDSVTVKKATGSADVGDRLEALWVEHPVEDD